MQPPHGDDMQLVTVRRSDGSEDGGQNTEAADMNFSQGRLGSDLEQLAAAVVADAGHESCPPDLLLEERWANVIELLRTVNGERIWNLPSDRGEHPNGRNSAAEVYVQVAATFANHPVA